MKTTSRILRALFFGLFGLLLGVAGPFAMGIAMGNGAVHVTPWLCFFSVPIDLLGGIVYGATYDPVEHRKRGDDSDSIDRPE